MKKIIDGVLYNTQTAELVAEKCDNWDTHNFNFCHESIFRTKKGNFFFHGEGGAASKYAEYSGNSSSFGEIIRTLSDDQVFKLLESWNEVESLEQLFPNRIIEG
jgi:hypothetical protein